MATKTTGLGEPPTGTRATCSFRRRQSYRGGEKKVFNANKRKKHQEKYEARLDKRRQERAEREAQDLLQVPTAHDGD